MNQQRICHIIVAAGSGSRFGARLPKQYCLLGNRPVLMETIDRMRRYGGDGAEIVLVISADMRHLWDDICEQHKFVTPTIVYGGATRWESVRNAIATTAAQSADVITVHDGARPIITRQLMDRVMAVDGDGCIPVVEVTDSLRRILPDGRSEAADRSVMRAVQTPQAFRGDMLRHAYTLPYSPAFTDDASVMEAAGHNALRLVDGDPCNIKITRPGDIEIALMHMR